jgi:hypothetical protein
MHSSFRPVFGSKPVQIRSTPKAVTPFGGLCSLFEFFNKIGLASKLQEVMPFTLSSPNAIPPAHTLMAFLSSVIAGAKRFAHTDWLRSDKALHVMLGIERFPGTDTVRNLFARFTQGTIETFWRPLWRWLLPLFEQPKEGFSLDLDSTVFQRSGQQEGAAKGYNPRRPGRKTHHPLLAVLAEAQCVLHAWLRSGNTSASRGVSHFLAEALSLFPSHWKIRCVRADSGFFAQELLGFLEQRALPYLVVVKLTQTIKRRAAGIRNWTEVDADYAVGEFFAKLQGWEKERRFVVVRERVREAKEAVGRKLIDVPGYTFRIFVTNRSADPLELWRDYNKRAVIEQRIEEIKAELHADGFCMKDFFATESAFLAVLFTFNLLSLYQKVAQPEAGYRQPATLRAAAFLGGAVLGRAARKPVLLLSEAWGGLKKHMPLIERILVWKIPTSPKLESAPSDPLMCCSI